MSAIVVLVKQVPDYETDNSLDDNYCLERESVDKILDEANENAVEAALQINEARDDKFEVVALSMGPESAVEAVRRALAMGADRGIHICDDAIAGSDATQTSWVLANALGHIADTQMVICGDQSSDAGMGSVPATIAEYLGIPALTNVNELSLGDNNLVQAGRTTDGYTYQLEAELPALVSVTEQANEPRFPSFKGLMAAKKQEVETWGLADIGVTEAQVGLAGAGTAVESTTERPAKEQGDVYPDNGTGAKRIFDYLVAEKFVAAE
ncbi:MAG: electron transfer flavoprotein subunit beta/FixA family protein [Lawsonella sp.]|nr:electron transfer flavoprotein subunit beta/FixA family protein [Mycobacteriales bacterium]